MSRRVLPLLAACALAGAVPGFAQSDVSPAERVSFDQAVQRALDRKPTVAQATQAILRAQALLDQANSVFRPLLEAGVGTTILDDARGFDDFVTQPRVQTGFNASLSFPLLDAARWAQSRQAADRVAISRISAEEVRKNVALAAAESYLAVIAAERQREIATRNRDTAAALDDYARARLQAGQGSRLNALRAAQELATSASILEAAKLAVRAAQTALGVAVYHDGPIEVNGDPILPPPVPASGDEWLDARPDIRLYAAQLRAAERIVADSWKDRMPTVTASFTPRYVTPAGLFEPAKTWRAAFELRVPLFDATLGPARRLRIADRESARLQLDEAQLQARSEQRLAREAVASNEQIVTAARRAAESAAEVLGITEIAYRAGATTNIEVVQAQQTARNSSVAAALAEDRLQRARLDLLVALGQFPR